MDRPTGADAQATDEEAAWAAVAARWRDDDAHQAYLAAHSDLDGLAEAGRRYRRALEQDPGDPVALRWRDEVVRRATVIALAQLPRTREPRMSPLARRAVAVAGIVLLLVALSYALMRFGAGGGAGAR